MTLFLFFQRESKSESKAIENPSSPPRVTDFPASVVLPSFLAFFTWTTRLPLVEFDRTPSFLNNHRHSLLDVCGLVPLLVSLLAPNLRIRPTFFLLYTYAFRKQMNDELGRKGKPDDHSHYYHIHYQSITVVFQLSSHPLPSYPNRQTFARMQIFILSVTRL